MRKNYKRMIMALVCAVALMTQAVTAYAANIDSMTCNQCQGDDFVYMYTDEKAINSMTCSQCQGDDFVYMYTENKGYAPVYGTMTHKVLQFAYYRCTNCEKVNYKILINTTEGCHWIKYEDLGHQLGEDHKYRLTCGYCHSTYEITLITCPGGETGKHITPW